MEMSGSAAPKDTFTQSQTEGEAVRQTGFRLQGQCTAIDKRQTDKQSASIGFYDCLSVSQFHLDS